MLQKSSVIKLYEKVWSQKMLLILFISHWVFFFFSFHVYHFFFGVICTVRLYTFILTVTFFQVLIFASKDCALSASSKSGTCAIMQDCHVTTRCDRVMWLYPSTKYGIPDFKIYTSRRHMKHGGRWKYFILTESELNFELPYTI